MSEYVLRDGNNPGDYKIRKHTWDPKKYCIVHEEDPSKALISGMHVSVAMLVVEVCNGNMIHTLQLMLDDTRHAT